MLLVNKRVFFIFVGFAFCTITLLLKQAYAIPLESKPAEKKLLKVVDVKAVHKVFNNAFMGAQPDNTQKLGLAMGDSAAKVIPSNYAPFYFWHKKATTAILGSNDDRVIEVLVQPASKKLLKNYVVDSDRFMVGKKYDGQWREHPKKLKNPVILVEDEMLKVFPEGGKVITKKYIQTSDYGEKRANILQSTDYEVLIRSMPRKEYEKAIEALELNTESSVIPVDDKLKNKPFDIASSYNPAQVMTQNEFHLHEDVKLVKKDDGEVLITTDPILGNALITHDNSGNIFVESPLTVTRCKKPAKTKDNIIVLAESGSSPSIHLSKTSGIGASSHKKINVISSKSTVSCISMSRDEYVKYLSEDG